MIIEPEISGVSIVLVGELNPAIFHPAWFQATGMLNADEVEGAKVELVHRELAVFKVGDWVTIKVEPSRFIAETIEPPFVRICDLVVRTFGEFLSHTPLRVLGINRRVHFDVGSEETRNQIGMILAPQEPWGEWAKDIAGEDEGSRGGMISLTMQQTRPGDRDRGWIRAKVEPSSKLKGNSGVFVDINDHYDLDDGDTSCGASRVIDVLARQFDASLRRSEWIIDQIMSLKDRL